MKGRFGLGLLLAIASAVDHPEVRLSSSESLVSSPLRTREWWMQEFPNLLTGTFSRPGFSTGNTLPLVARPFGFNHWSLHNSPQENSWWFEPDLHEFRWLRLTHQPSPWISDWAWLRFGPQMGGLTQSPTMFFEPRAAHLKPYGMDITLAPDNMRIHFTPTDHCGVLRVEFPISDTPRRVCFLTRMTQSSPADAGLFMEMVSTERQNDHINPTPGDYGLRIRAEVDVKSLKQPGSASLKEAGMVTCFEFSPQETSVTVWIGTSLISKEMAESNLKSEVRDRTYESVLHESRMVWREMLSRVDVEDAGPTSEQASRRLTIFYTGLYRSLLFPRRLDEVDPNGKVLHYSPYDQQGRTREGYCVTDNGFWDTFRTCYTVLALAYPDHLDKIVQGWLNAYREGGWLPQWSSPGYRSAMVGTFSDNVIADAVLKDVLSADWLDHAFAALSQDAFVQGDSGRGKKDYAFYDANGYIGDDAGVSDEVSLTLDYGFADYAAACAFAKMGKSTEAGKLRARSHKAVGALFDEQTGLMRPKSRAGSFTSNFSPNRWGYGYVEGSPWHHSFPPYDLRELSRLHGSAEKLARKIHEMLVTPSFFQAGSYGGEIHEMTEMRAFAMGQYGHNNQPSHHILHLLLSLDGSRQECAAPECDDAHPECLTSSKTLLTAADNSAPFCARLVGESAVHDVLERGYGVEHYAGDEDNGEMGAWYVLSALGLFEPAPGTDYGYALGSPLFRRVAIWRGVARGSSDTPTLLIESRKAGTLAVRHVQRVLLDGAEIGPQNQAAAEARSSIAQSLDWTVAHKELFGDRSAWKRGGVLRFLTGNETVAEENPITVRPLDRNLAKAEPLSAPVHSMEAPLPPLASAKGGLEDRYRLSLAQRYSSKLSKSTVDLSAYNAKSLKDQEIEAATNVLPLVFVFCFAALIYFRCCRQRGDGSQGQQASSKDV